MKNPVNNKPKYNPWMLYGGIIFILFAISLTTGGGSFGGNKTIGLSTFYKYLDGNQIEKVVFNNSSAQVFLNETAKNTAEHQKDNKPTLLSSMSSGPDYVVEIANKDLFEEKLIQASNEGKIKEFSNEKESNWSGILFSLLPIILIPVVWIFMMRRMGGGASGGGGGQIFSIGKSRARLFDEKNDSRVTFNDVAGLEGAKEEIQEIVEFLKNPEKYTSIGGKIPKGALLVGPPGTGKTLLAKAVAGEAQVPFFSLSGSDFVEMFVGVGASRVRDLFKQAKEKSPAIIFIDEIDAIGRARGKSNFSGSNDERENTLNQLLTEMDGFGTNTNVIVLAATNRAEILDKALMRAGRFDRQIYVDLPDVNERKQIFEVHLKKIKKVENLDVDFLAKQTPGFSGADIANVCNEAALTAARKGKTEVDKQDFLDAVDRIVGGLEKKNKIITPEAQT